METFIESGKVLAWENNTNNLMGKRTQETKIQTFQFKYKGLLFVVRCQYRREFTFKNVLMALKAF